MLNGISKYNLIVISYTYNVPIISNLLDDGFLRFLCHSPSQVGLVGTVCCEAKGRDIAERCAVNLVAVVGHTPEKLKL